MTDKLSMNSLSPNKIDKNTQNSTNKDLEREKKPNLSCVKDKGNNQKDEIKNHIFNTIDNNTIESINTQKINNNNKPLIKKYIYINQT